MNASNIVENITAVGATIIAVLAAVTAFLVAVRPLLKDMLAELRGTRKELEKNTEELEKNTAVTEDSHTMINSQREAAIEQQTKTDNLLRAAGIPLPTNPAHITQVTGTEEP